jgi:hypothetical protein
VSGGQSSFISTTEPSGHVLVSGPTGVSILVISSSISAQIIPAATGPKMPLSQSSTSSTVASSTSLKTPSHVSFAQVPTSSKT